MNMIHNLFAARPILLLITLSLAFRRVFARPPRRPLVHAWNTVGTHDGAVTRKAQAAITTRHLLGTIGSESAAHVAVADAGDVPLYAMPDEAATGDLIACELLGSLGRTVRLVAADEITPGTEVYGVAGGKVAPLPEDAGTYYLVGRALTGAEDEDQVIEAVSCVARAVVVAA